MTWWEVALQVISLTGSVLSATGVYLAIEQLKKTQKAAEAARDASQAAERGIARNVLIADISVSGKMIDEIKAFLRSCKYELALVRVSDLTAIIIQLQHVGTVDAAKPDHRAREALTSLSVLRDLLEEKLYDECVVIDTAKVNSELARISDRLGHWVGRRKFSVIGEAHGSR
jgi:hypothetical protein